MVWPFVVGRAGEGLGRKGLSFCRDHFRRGFSHLARGLAICQDPSFQSLVKASHKRSGHLSSEGRGKG